jgi:hypothetical protein
MRLAVLPLAFLATFAFAGEDDLAKKLVGTWRFEAKEQGVTISGVTRYKADGTWSSKGAMTFAGQKIELNSEGKWTLEGKKLSLEVTKSNDPDFMEVGETWTETIISITDTEFRYLDAEGEETVEKREK